MALYIREERILSFSVYCLESKLVVLMPKQLVSQSRYTSLAKMDRGRRFLPGESQEKRSLVGYSP